MNAYRLGEHIGDGAHGHVWKAFSLRTEKWVALKRIRCRKYGGGGGQNNTTDNVLREIQILSTIDCKYVSTYATLQIGHWLVATFYLRKDTDLSLRCCEISYLHIISCLVHASRRVLPTSLRRLAAAVRLATVHR